MGVYSLSAMGGVLASGMHALLQATLTTTQLNSWGWRIPFWLGSYLHVCVCVCVCFGKCLLIFKNKKNKNKNTKTIGLLVVLVAVYSRNHFRESSEFQHMEAYENPLKQAFTHHKRSSAELSFFYFLFFLDFSCFVYFLKNIN